MNQPAPTAKDSDTSTEAQGFEPLTAADLLQAEDQVLVIQKLLKSNEALLSRVSMLEASLNDCHIQSRMWEQQATQLKTPQTLSSTASFTSDTLPLRSLSPESLPSDCIDQADLIAALTQQLEVSLQRVADFERNSVLQQQRHREQTHRLRQLEQDYQLLQRRVQREQNHSLQLKTALEKTLREQHEDPSWLEQIWLQLNRDGTLTEPAPAISSWVAEPSAPVTPEPLMEEIPSGLDIEALVAQLDHDENSPWSASQVLFLDEQDEFLSPTTPAALELPCWDSSDTADSENLAGSSLIGPTELLPPPPADRGSPAIPEPVESAPSSCSFQLNDGSEVQPSRPQPVPQRSAPAIDLPPFLRRR